MTLRPLILTFVGLCLVLAFQNCSNPQRLSFTSVASKAEGQTDENGRPYDGKVYLLLGAVCPDGSDIRGRIRLKTRTSADLLRDNCQETTPVALSADQFQLIATDQLQYQNQIYVNTLVGTKMDLSLAYLDSGFAYILEKDFGTPPDSGANTAASLLQIYEDGQPLGPAHSPHPDIRSFGQGRFSYWWSGSINVLRFSSSDQTNPVTNGRTYTYKILSQVPPAPAIALQSITPGTSDALNTYYQFNYSGTAQFARVLLDTDNNVATGLTDHSGLAGLGAEYMVENGQLYRYSGSNGAWGWTAVKAVTFTNTASGVTMAVPRADIGAPVTLHFVVEIQNSAGELSRSSVYKQTF